MTITNSEQTSLTLEEWGAFSACLAAWSNPLYISGSIALPTTSPGLVHGLLALAETNKIDIELARSRAGSPIVRFSRK